MAHASSSARQMLHPPAVHGESEARTSVEGMARSLVASSRVGLSDDCLRRFRPAPLKADEKEPEEGAAG